MQQRALAEPAMTIDEFLTWSARHTEGRYELVDGKVEEMPTEGGRQNTVKFEVAIALREAVSAANLACHVFTDGMTVRIDERRGREPDAAVTVGPVADFDALEIIDPLIVVEVVSPHSVVRDTVDKLADYFRVPSIEHYLIINPQQRLMVHHQRLPGDAGEILTRILQTGQLRFDPPGIEFSVDRILASAR